MISYCGGVEDLVKKPLQSFVQVLKKGSRPHVGPLFRNDHIVEAHRAMKVSRRRENSWSHLAQSGLKRASGMFKPG